MARVRTFAVWLWLVLPLAILLGAQLGDQPSDIEVQQSLRTSLPESEQVLLAYVDALRSAGRTSDALESAKEFSISHPESERVHRALLLMSTVVVTEMLLVTLQLFLNLTNRHKLPLCVGRKPPL